MAFLKLTAMQCLNVHQRKEHAHTCLWLYRTKLNHAEENIKYKICIYIYVDIYIYIYISHVLIFALLQMMHKQKRKKRDTHENTINNNDEIL